MRFDPTVEISGRVTRGGVGVADVEVGPEGGIRLRATTASDGSFVLGGLLPGLNQLQFRKREELIDEKRTITAPARDVAIDLPRGGTMRGRVEEKGTKTPIRSFRAGVLVGWEDTRGFASEDGSFTLHYLPAGEMTLAVEAFGHLPTYTDVTVVKGEGLTDVVVELDPGVRLTGTVTDANGAPLTWWSRSAPYARREKSSSGDSSAAQSQSALGRS